MNARIAVVIVASIIFVLDWYGMHTGYTQMIDEQVAHWAMGFRETIPKALVLFLTNMEEPAGTVSFIIAVLIVLFIIRRYREALYFFIATFGAIFISDTLKHLIMRHRPPYMIIEKTNYSFPSGHANASMAIAVGLYFIARSIRGNGMGAMLILGLGLFWTGVIGFTRLYLGVHWFSDIVAGWMFGMAWASLVALFFFKDNRT
jgi:undecaprenyl-diphosphatase